MANDVMQVFIKRLSKLSFTKIFIPKLTLLFSLFYNMGLSRSADELYANVMINIANGIVERGNLCE
ncbi:hypothetical protein T4B_13316 [Trichinella pseudospiralis]|uniref:Uncharacterized protein n=1 Tax=Trichinella pseudospiralis TaxID=6337 RepID=A0A0V1K3R1_TRIPS|nr:hypothetical protein T4A_12566 [Trichinella pseudospiralis]KRZ19563.1 hypothetical protein T4B_13316 [Trichinella pseudospiralis]KRZ41895.1 hypothetical protein T4C_13221 [Trichinella pseudospiralis]